MYRRIVCVGLAFVVFASLGSTTEIRAAENITRIALAEPSISPDRSEIAFVAGGDIWAVPANGGTARLLISNGATSSRPMYAPDGKHLAFISTRAGHADLGILDFGDATIRRITHDDGFAGLDGWSHDGSVLYFESISHQVGSTPCIMRVPANGGTPTIVFRERYVASSQAAVRPGSDDIAFVDGGFPQWWRHGHSHIDESAIALYHPGAIGTARFARLSEGRAVEHWPMWSADGQRLYYVSDRDGTPNLLERIPGARARQLTHFTTGRLVFPAIANDGKTIVFERDFGIWRYDIGGDARELRVTLAAAPTQADPQHLAIASRFGELALSPDGKKIAFTARGQIFAASAKDGGAGLRVTHTSANEAAIAWAPDSRRIAYVSDRDGDEAIFMYDFGTDTETRITAAERDYAPAFSPDGTSLAFLERHRSVRVVDLAKKTTRTLASGAYDEIEPFGDRHALAFSPDGAFLAFTSRVTRGYVVVEAVPSSGGTPRAIDRLANTGTGNIAWAPDGKRVYFLTGQRTEPGQIAQVDLIARTPLFKEDEFRRLFTESTPAEPGMPARTRGPSQLQPSVVPSTEPTPEPTARALQTPRTRIDFDGIGERASLLPTGIDVGEIALARDGKSLVFTGNAAGQSNVYRLSVDPLDTEPSVAKQLTSSLGLKSNLNLAADGSAYYLENGRAFIASPDGRTRPLPLAAELDVDFTTEKTELFNQAWRGLQNFYADPKFNGVDWNAVHATYEPLVRGAHNVVELRRLLNLMVGELNSSHSGVGAPRDLNASRSGYLGVEFDGAFYEKTHRLKIAEIVPLGPLALALARTIRVGDELEAVGGTKLAPNTNLETLLENSVGKRIVIRVSGHDVVVSPIDASTASGLAYRAWVASRRTLVNRLSGGRLGYVHLQDMGEESLARLTIDLDTDNQAKDGVVVDIRNNNGGFVDPYVTDIFSRRNYVNFIERGYPLAPERPSLGQRTLDRPTVLVTNAHSLSDAENFTEDYRRAHLGKVVGEPTAGWIIFTYSLTMVDGSRVRIPRTQTLTLDGQNMENHPRPVDVLAARTLGEDERDIDSQLAVAVSTLLRGLPHRSAP